MTYTKFDNLEPEKRERIMNAAIDEFVRNGYEKASTNEIVKKAGISKGSLFQYFHNKKALYLYVLDDVSKVTLAILDEMDWNERDFFIRLRDIGRIKFTVVQKYPEAFRFLKSAAEEDAEEVKPEIESRHKRMLDSGIGKIYENIDWTLFRDDMDLQKMIQIINWTMVSYGEEQRKKIPSFHEMNREMFQEWEQYFDILKRCFYKNQEEVGSGVSRSNEEPDKVLRKGEGSGSAEP